MKNTVFIKGIAALSLGLSLVLGGCQKEEKFEGPSLVDLYGDFSVLSPLQASNGNVNFEEGQTTTFTALFSKNVNWTLKITGVESGAVKLITGFSNELNATNARWNGTTTQLPMFRAEECMVELSFQNEEEILETTLSVAAPKTNNGLLLADFESGLPAGWQPFVQSGANMSFTVTSSDVAGQGNFYYDMGGEVNWDYLIGLVRIFGTGYGEGPHFPLSSNPNVPYYNVLLYNPPGITNGFTVIQFFEDDNGDGVYQNTEDMWALQTPTGLDPGWHKISSRYSDLQNLVNGLPAPAIGNGLHEPDKLLRIEFLFLANPVTGYSQSYIDYMIFTENGELQP